MSGLTIEQPEPAVLGTSPDSDAPPVLRAIEDHVRRHAGRFFEEPDDLCRASASQTTDGVVRLVGQKSRKFTHVFEFDLGGRERRIVAKVPLEVTPESYRTQPDSVAEGPEPYYEHEHAALLAIHEHFTALRDPRFGTVRVLDLLSDSQAILMERVAAPTLHDELLRVALSSPRLETGDLDEAFNNVGGWLRHFHALPQINASRERLKSRDDLVASVGRSVATIAGSERRSRLFRDLPARFEDAVTNTLPERLPLVVGHADFAPHNIFVGPGARVTVFDTAANRMFPPLKDIAYFLMTLKLSSIHAIRFRRRFSPARVAEYEAAFLRGYYGRDENVPWTALRQFEMEALLKKWAARMHSQRETSGWRALAKRARLTWHAVALRRYLRDLAAGALNSAEQGGGAVVAEQPPCK